MLLIHFNFPSLCHQTVWIFPFYAIKPFQFPLFMLLINFNFPFLCHQKVSISPVFQLFDSVRKVFAFAQPLTRGSGDSAYRGCSDYPHQFIQWRAIPIQKYPPLTDSFKSKRKKIFCKWSTGVWGVYFWWEIWTFWYFCAGIGKKLSCVFFLLLS